MTEARMLTLPAEIVSTNLETVSTNFDRGSLFFIGTATVLLRYAGFTILTDPNFLHQGDLVHLHGWRSTRLTNPAIELEQLPALDLVILSHMHEDHFDRVVEQKLDKTLPIVTTHHAALKLQKKGFQATQPLKMWETIVITKGETRLCITAMPGMHGPGVLNAILPPVMGSMLEFQTLAGETKFRLYITGDTLLYEQLREIPQRYPDIDLALLHLGGTKILGILLTMDARQGVEAVQLIAPQIAIPIYYNDYTVFKSTIEDFMKAIARAGLERKIKYLSHGDTYEIVLTSSRRF